MYIGHWSFHKDVQYPAVNLGWVNIMYILICTRPLSNLVQNLQKKAFANGIVSKHKGLLLLLTYCSEMKTGYSQMKIILNSSETYYCCAFISVWIMTHYRQIRYQ